MSFIVLSIKKLRHNVYELDLLVDNGKVRATISRDDDLPIWHPDENLSHCWHRGFTPKRLIGLVGDFSDGVELHFPIDIPEDPVDIP